MISVNKNIKIILFIILSIITYDYWHFRGTQEILVFSFLLILSKYLLNLFMDDKKVRECHHIEPTQTVITILSITRFD